MRSEASPTARGKLADLRAKTDRDLALLLSHVIESGLRAANEFKWSEAEAAYARAARVLPVIRNVSLRELTSLETRVRELRTHLDRVASHACVAC